MVPGRKILDASIVVQIDDVIGMDNKLGTKRISYQVGKSLRKNFWTDASQQINTIQGYLDHDEIRQIGHYGLGILELYLFAERCLFKGFFKIFLCRV